MNNPDHDDEFADLANEVDDSELVAATNSRRRTQTIAVVILAVALIAAVGIVGYVIGHERTPATATSATIQRTTTPAAPTTASREELARRAEASHSSAVAAASALADAIARDRDPANYPPISDQDLAIIAKNPDAHTGEKYVIYGRVTQFDANTGPDGMRVAVAGQPQAWYDYDINAMAVGDRPDVLAQVVEDNLVTLYVRVNGATSYSTSRGGKISAPAFQVYRADVTGTTP